MTDRRSFLRSDVVLASTGVIATAMIGGALTRLDAWYYGLQQPWFKPPDWAFGPAWTVLFGLIAWSAVVAWRAGAHHPPRLRRTMLLLFGLNALANMGWSLLFFFLQRPDWALLEVPLLWGSILALMLFMWRWSRRSALLLIPYLLWVTLAALINLETVHLNGPFN
jgi:tryptophan-rich sensory protein